MTAGLVGERRFSGLAEVVARGLLAPRKRLPPYLFYDAAGSRLFEQITELPEYYPTRTERAIFAAHADAIVRAARQGARSSSVALELGAGTASKTQLLLEAFVRQQGRVVFLPVDVSPEPLAACRERLGRELPEVVVEPVVDRHEGALALLSTRGGHRVVLFIGSSIGNLDDDEARALLSLARRAMRPGDALVLGADRRKDVATLLAAYDDAAGVTAAFNRNVLARINRELGGRFDLARFAHRAVWNERASCVEMHLVSDRAQRVFIEALGLEVGFREGETIHTESSAKYDDEQLGRLFEASGFAERARFLDELGWFGVHVAEAVLDRPAPLAGLGASGGAVARCGAMARRTPPSSHGPTLFEAARKRDAPREGTVPLAERMRPRSIAEIVGQKHVLGPGKLLSRAIAEDRVPSMILWGPPGCGKTTLARVVAESTKARFVPYSAVLGGVPELRGILREALEARDYQGERTILFIDEIHRFNKSQQDALLPAVEAGEVVLIGATTENPSFAINAALLSRAKVFHLERVPDADVEALCKRALADADRGLGKLGLTAEPEALAAIARLADGDARRALGTLEAAAAHARSVDPHGAQLKAEHLAASNESKALLYDRAGEEHYNVASAFIKSLRGSDPDAAIYYMFRMLEAGEDPLFVSRRMMIFASEDIGNADPRALQVATSADAAFRRMGMPEGYYPLSHACLYLACAPKSDGVKRAMKAVREAIERGAFPVPKKLRNAPTKLMAEDEYGKGYRYAHDYEGNVVPGETYLPDELAGEVFYEPAGNGFEKWIKERLARLRQPAGEGGEGGGEGQGEGGA